MSQGNPSLKVFWLTNFWVDNIQLPAHHKTSVKTNKNQSIISKKFTIIFRRRSSHGLPYLDETLRLSKEWNWKTHRVNSKIHWDYQWFHIFPGWTKLSNNVGDVKNLNSYYRELILQTKLIELDSTGVKRQTVRRFCDKFIEEFLVNLYFCRSVSIYFWKIKKLFLN